MKRPVFLVASLVLIAGLTGACAKAPGKDDLAQACMKRMGGVQSKCDCYVGSIEKALAPDQFAALAKGAYDNKDFSGSDWLPNNVRANPAINAALSSANASCMTQSAAL